MSATTKRFRVTVTLLLGFVFINSALAEPLLGLTLLKSTVTDVQNLIAQSGAQVTEDKPLFRTGRVIRIQGGTLPGVQQYNNASFIFKSNNVLERYFLRYPLNKFDIYNERLQVVSSIYGQPKTAVGGATFATDFGVVMLSVNQATNELMEDWQQNSMMAKKQVATGQQQAGMTPCAALCNVARVLCSPPTNNNNRDYQLMIMQCQQQYSNCVQECGQ